MVCLERIEQLPASDRVKAYRDQASYFWAMAVLAHMDATKLAFTELAREMYDRADAVTMFAG